MLIDLDITPDDPAELRAVNRLLADGRMPKARPYLENGYLELDNNTA